MTPLSNRGTATPTAHQPGRPGAAEALAELLAGNRRFVAGEPRHGHHFRAAAAASGDQQPYALVLGCIDSRVPLEAVFDQNFGAICVARSGAHVLDRAVVGSVEFAVVQLAVPLVMVLGHERCGAIASTVEALRTGQRPAGELGYLVDQIAPAVAEAGGPDHPEAHARALRRHVTRTVDRLRGLAEAGRPDRVTGLDGAGDPALAIGLAGVDVVGAVYDLDTGRVELT